MNKIMNFQTKLSLCACHSHLTGKKRSMNRHTSRIAWHKLLRYSGLLGLLLALLLALKTASAADDTKLRVGILPGQGPVGTEVIVQISGFPPKTGILIAAREKTIIVQKTVTDADGVALATFKIPEQPAGWCQIWAYDETNVAWAMFTVVPSIELNKTSGYVSEEVSINAYGLAQKREVTVYFDGKKVATGQTNEKGTVSELTFKIPKSCRGKHTITVDDGKNESQEASFLVRQKITVAPKTGQPGEEVTVIGTGFTASADVLIYFDDKDVTLAPTDDSGSFTAKFRVPKAAGGMHSIKVDDGENRYYEDFSIEATIDCRPKEGAVGEKVTVEGSGFSQNTPITVTFDNKKISSATSTAEGSFICTFNVPSCVHGERTITVSDGANTKQDKFIVESTPPPTPALIYPSSGSRVTTITHFQWQEVTDPSGVKYILEVATDPEFSNTIISGKNLTSPQFTLSAEQQKLLKPAKDSYFWRVRAVDGAFNSSNWAEAGIFFVGATASTIVKNMPSWVTYALLGLLFALIATFFYYLGYIKSQKQPSYEEEPLCDEQNPYWDQYNETGHIDQKKMSYK